MRSPTQNLPFQFIQAAQLQGEARSFAGQRREFLARMQPASANQIGAEQIQLDDHFVQHRGIALHDTKCALKIIVGIKSAGPVERATLQAWLRDARGRIGARGTLVDVEFAVSEHIGRWQIGVAGYYLRQLADDLRSGVSVAPDGRRLQTLSLGGVFSYEMADINAAIKLKVRSSVFSYNSAMVSTVILSFAKKLYSRR